VGVDARELLPPDFFGRTLRKIESREKEVLGSK